jgi:hypothetical protein
MSDREYAEFRERSEVSYAAGIAASRAVPLPEARRQAAEDHERLLPEGVRTPGHYLWTACDGNEPVGGPLAARRTKAGWSSRLRLRVRGAPAPGTSPARLWPGDNRGGRAKVSRDKCRVHRPDGFGLNKAAQRLYEDLGFEVTVLQMRKHLSTA